MMNYKKFGCVLVYGMKNKIVKPFQKHFGKMSVRIMIKPLFQEVIECDIRFIQLDDHTFTEEIIFIYN